MKKFNNYFMLAVALLGSALIYSCSDDDDSPEPAGEPAITSFAPIKGPAGTEITVTGENLAEATVKFGEADVAATSSETTVTFTVPEGTELGLVGITVTTEGGTATSADDFEVTRYADNILLVEDFEEYANSEGTIGIYNAAQEAEGNDPIWWFNWSDPNAWIDNTDEAETKFAIEASDASVSNGTRVRKMEGKNKAELGVHGSDTDAGGNYIGSYVGSSFTANEAVGAPALLTGASDVDDLSTVNLLIDGFNGDGANDIMLDVEFIGDDGTALWSFELLGAVTFSAGATEWETVSLSLDKLVNKISEPDANGNIKYSSAGPLKLSKVTKINLAGRTKTDAGAYDLEYDNIRLEFN